MQTTTSVGTAEPLLAAQTGGDNPKKKMKVMVAIDESDCSFYALRWALDHLFIGPADHVAKSTGTATVEAGGRENVSLVTLVHAMQPFQHYVLPAGPGGTAFYAAPSVLESVRKAQEESADAVLSPALQMCNDKMINAETLILSGDPKDLICQATEQMHVDLLVVGSRGLGMIKRAFLGSVSDYCAHHATCPVLIVKPPKESGK